MPVALVLRGPLREPGDGINLPLTAHLLALILLAHRRRNPSVSGRFGPRDWPSGRLVPDHRVGTTLGPGVHGPRDPVGTSTHSSSSTGSRVLLSSAVETSSQLSSALGIIA